jgi:hypothetical protein
LEEQKEKLSRSTAQLEMILRGRSDDEHEAFAQAQAKADAVYNEFGRRAPRPLEGEDVLRYRMRLATEIKGHSHDWKDSKLSKLSPDVFAIAEKQIFADAIISAKNPRDLRPGEFREVVRVDPTTNQRIVTFQGTECFVKQMGRPGRRLVNFNTNPGRQAPQY